MLQDKHILYPEEVDFSTMVGKCQETLNAAKANRAVWMDELMDWENFIPFLCLEYGVNPGWIFTCLQRERSLLGKEGEAKDFDFATGVVGQDKPGTVNPRWNGLPSQLMRAVRLTAWWTTTGWNPRRKGLEPSSEHRWIEGGKNLVDMLDLQSKPIGTYVAKNKAEYAQLSFTPHMEVLEKNDSIYRKWAPLFY